MDKSNELFLASTDTVVGIGAPMSNANRLAINKLKGSPSGKRLVVMVASIAMAREHFSKRGFDESAELLAHKYWPGSTTLIVSDDLALRIPNAKRLLSLIEHLGPIYMTSANITGEQPLTWDAARQTFPHLNAYYNFGTGTNIPSKIIDVRTGKVIR